VAWLRSQPWFDGRLATFGGSYLGFVQWALLGNPPEELRAAIIVVGPNDFSRALHGSGAFALSMGFGWSKPWRPFRAPVGCQDPQKCSWGTGVRAQVSTAFHS
jgi:predicted acyl esterase